MLPAPLLEDADLGGASWIERALGDAVVVGTAICLGIAGEDADAAVLLNAGRAVGAIRLSDATLDATSSWKVGIDDTHRPLRTGPGRASAGGTASTNDVALFSYVKRIAAAGCHGDE